MTPHNYGIRIVWAIHSPLGPRGLKERTFGIPISRRRAIEINEDVIFDIRNCGDDRKVLLSPILTLAELVR